jgi:uncharacterized protein YbgA (DUF1722 family)/uncharacterized protein YbbK (DUF523 family)
MTQTPERVRIGVSSCLMGERVRYDGGHKRDAFLVDVFGRFVEWVPVCPEMEMGLGAPRDFLRLVDAGGEVRMIAPTTGTDQTASMNGFLRTRIPGLRREGLAGFIFKRSSPSCGLERVRIYKNDVPAARGQGLFAAGITRAFPNLPVEEEGRLNDPRLRENFVTRVFAYQRWMNAHQTRFTRRALMEYHARHKFVLMAHSQQGLRRLGRLLGESGSHESIQTLVHAYWDGFSEVMRRPPTRRNHTNTLRHVAGYVSDQLDEGDRNELTETIENYRLGRLPLIVPVTLLRHYVRRLGEPYLESQVYLSPHPDELMLLNQL